MNIFTQLKSIIRNLRLSKTLVVYGDGKATFAKEQRGATGSDKSNEKKTTKNEKKQTKNHPQK
jgi:dihydrofolate reductase